MHQYATTTIAGIRDHHQDHEAKRMQDQEMLFVKSGNPI
jgi:hypothetical protein